MVSRLRLRLPLCIDQPGIVSDHLHVTAIIVSNFIRVVAKVKVPWGFRIDAESSLAQGEHG